MAKSGTSVKYTRTFLAKSNGSETQHTPEEEDIPYSCRSQRNSTESITGKEWLAVN